MQTTEQETVFMRKNIPQNNFERIEYALKKINNIHPDRVKDILDKFLNSTDISMNTATSVFKEIKKYLGIVRAVGKHTEEYWITRGWPVRPEQGKIKRSKPSPFSQKFWTDQGMTAEQADYKRNSMRPIRKEYWLEKGYSEEEAIKLASDKKDSNNKKGAEASKNEKVKNKHRHNSVRSIEYWMMKGHSEDSARNEVSKAQNTFSIEKCIEKYGVEEGTKRWEKRQDKWQETLTSKSQEEIKNINRSKTSFGSGYSKISQELFNSIGIPEARYATNGGEYRIKLNSNKHVSFDYLYENKVIEFHGDVWHANPLLYKEDSLINVFGRLNNVPALEIWEKDAKRIEEIKRMGYEILVVWESEFKNEKNKTIQKCLKFLTEN